MRRVILPALLLAAGPLAANMAITPAPCTNVVINPGKGWVTYGRTPPADEELLSLTGAGYARYSWSDIEPEEGVFRWAPIDDAIAAWANAGRQFAFGVMCASTHSHKDRPFVTPEWVFKAGARHIEIELTPKEPTTGTPGRKIAPVFDDPIFLQKLAKFIAALGARYDGNPSIAFVDVRSYGNWGEGHMHPFKVPDASPETLKQHLEMHRAAFKKTPLMIPWGSRKFDPVYDDAVAKGMGLRRDGICGNSDGSETARCLGRTLAVFEFFGGYQWMKDKGWWDGRPDRNGCGHKLADCVEKGAPSFVGPLNQGPDGKLMIREEPRLVRTLANRMGYFFVLRSATMPDTILAGLPIEVDFLWENLGVAPIVVPASVSLAFLDAKGTIVDSCPARASKPSAWAPGKPVTVSEAVSFPNAPQGNYRLAVGIFRPNEKFPSIKIGIDVPVVNGWHILAPISAR